MMKKLKRIGMMVVLITVVMTSCEKTDDLSTAAIEGTYVGTLSIKGQENASIRDGGTATAVVTKVGNGLVKVHCFGTEIDTTIVLNYYDNHDSVMVCLTDSNFEHMYGHALGQGHIGGGMMGDRTNDETEWQHHMGDEHMTGDEHFGGFDMENHSFEYRFKMMDVNESFFMNFRGEKND